MRRGHLGLLLCDPCVKTHDKALKGKKGKKGQEEVVFCCHCAEAEKEASRNDLRTYIRAALEKDVPLPDDTSDNGDGGTAATPSGKD